MRYLLSLTLCLCIPSVLHSQVASDWIKVYGGEQTNSPRLEVRFKYFPTNEGGVVCKFTWASYVDARSTFGEEVSFNLGFNNTSCDGGVPQTNEQPFFFEKAGEKHDPGAWFLGYGTITNIHTERVTFPSRHGSGHSTGSNVAQANESSRDQERKEARKDSLEQAREQAVEKARQQQLDENERRKQEIMDEIDRRVDAGNAANNSFTNAAGAFVDMMTTNMNKSRIKDLEDERNEAFDALRSRVRKEYGELIDCPSCDGRGTNECNDCEGQGYTNCTVCDGTGNQRCGYCSGTGAIGNARCFNCAGKGNNVCGSCFGKGSSMCSTCAGVGHKNCGHCNGTGRMFQSIERPATSWNAGHAATEQTYSAPPVQAPDPKEVEYQRALADAMENGKVAARERAMRVIGTIADGMVLVEGGSFRMGCAPNQGGKCEKDAKAAHDVIVSDFYLSKFELTDELYRRISAETYYENVTEKRGAEGCPTCPMNFFPGPSQWENIQRFIDRLNELTGEKYRLPTEAEWEFAARGGVKGNGKKYAGSDRLDNVAWYGMNAGEQLHPVGEKTPNELGLYDILGNVKEWCSDWYDSKYYDGFLARTSLSATPAGAGSTDNPQGPAQGEVIGERLSGGGGQYLYAEPSHVARGGSVVEVDAGQQWACARFHLYSWLEELHPLQGGGPYRPDTSKHWHGTRPIGPSGIRLAKSK